MARARQGRKEEVSFFKLWPTLRLGRFLNFRKTQPEFLIHLFLDLRAGTVRQKEQNYFKFMFRIPLFFPVDKLLD